MCGRDLGYSSLEYRETVPLYLDLHVSRKVIISPYGSEIAVRVNKDFFPRFVRP